MEDVSRHSFVPFIKDEFICQKCGAVAITLTQVQSFMDYDRCLVSDDDPRCAETARSIAKHIDDATHFHKYIDDFDEWKASGTVGLEPSEPEQVFTPSMLKNCKEYLDWLNSTDPIKALWGIE